jgi:hypothetical protein
MTNPILELHLVLIKLHGSNRIFGRLAVALVVIVV